MTGSGADRWRRVEAAFESALRAAPEARAAAIEEACGDDRDLRAEVESLLFAHVAATDFLETPADALAAPYLDELDRGADGAGRVIGRYRLIEPIGRGGMGDVWLGERADGEFEQRVAVKLVKRGMDTDEILARFLHERRILARLEHPHIARLLDGGATPDGRPYFVMEHVAGIPITEYCETHAVSVEDRLTLFETVCRAVQHAHRNLVVHRDIKPSNVLVTEEGEVKLLDFGISKLLEEEGDESAPALTRTGVHFVTPDYASPEQVRGETVTTQSDVYQLGLLLYELLTGERPYHLKGRSPTEIERVVCHEEPARPSVRARDLEDGGRSRLLRGDLDTIVLAALRKEPARRYASAEALAEDVRRHRVGLPVTARGDGLGYRAGKFVRRNRAPVTAAGALLLVSAAFAILYTVRLREERDQVRVEAEKATASAQLLESFFVSWNPDAANPEEITALDLLDVAADRAGRPGGGSPEARAATLSLIGSLYTRLNAYPPAESLLLRAEREQRRRGASSDLASTLERLGHMLLTRGELAGAEARYREALAMRRALYGPDDPRALAGQASLAAVLWYTERFAEAEIELRDLLSRHDDPDDLPVYIAEATSLLGTVLFFEGRLAEAEAVLRDALAGQKRFLGEDDPVTLNTAGVLGGVLRDLGKLEEAERLHRDALAQAIARFGDAHPRALLPKFLLGLVLERKAEYEESETLARELLDQGARVLGPGHPATNTYRLHLGAVLLDRGELEEAEQLLLRTKAVAERAGLTDEAGDWLNRLAYIRLRRVEPGAREAYREAIAFHRSRPPDDPAFVTDGLHYLAWTMDRMGDHVEAEALYRRALELYRPALPPDHPYIAATLAGLGERTR